MFCTHALLSSQAVVIFIFTAQAISTKQLLGNNLCINHDAVVSQFRYCSEPFIGNKVIGADNKTEIKCPKDSVILIISIHPFNDLNSSPVPGCQVICSSKLFQENCKENNSSCFIRIADVLQTQECRDIKAEINFVCFKTKASPGVDQDLKRRGKSLLCSRFLHSVDNFTSFKQQRTVNHQTFPLHSKPSTMANVNGSFKISFSTTNRHKTKMESSHKKRELMFISSTRLYQISSSTEDPGTNKSSESTPYDSNKSLHENYSIPRETFLGRQVSLWFSSINEPQLIGIFIKSNLEKFVLYVVVFICFGVMSVMGVVIYSLAYQIKHRRTYSVNKSNQQKAGKITYHSPNNWRTPDSGSSTGDDRTLHDDEANAMDRTDSRHAMCSSITETRSNREENPMSPHQPLNNNSVRGSTTLPSPPNSLIFERASPLAPNEGSESPREKPNTPSHADVHFADRLSS